MSDYNEYTGRWFLVHERYVVGVCWHGDLLCEDDTIEVYCGLCDVLRVALPWVPSAGSGCVYQGYEGDSSLQYRGWCSDDGVAEGSLSGFSLRVLAAELVFAGLVLFVELWLICCMGRALTRRVYCRITAVTLSDKDEKQATRDGKCRLGSAAERSLQESVSKRRLGGWLCVVAPWSGGVSTSVAGSGVPWIDRIAIGDGCEIVVWGAVSALWMASLWTCWEKF
nr:hypothetical protein Iba_chr04eCG13240 [Ipomoea batatas]